MSKRNTSSIKTLDALSSCNGEDHYRLAEGLAYLVIRKVILNESNLTAFVKKIGEAAQDVSVYENGTADVSLKYRLKLSAETSLGMFRLNLLVAYLIGEIGKDLNRIIELKGYYQKNIQCSGIDKFEDNVKQTLELVESHV